MKRIIIFVLAVLGLSTSMPAQNPELPNDPAVKVGKLDNGLTYYIRHNDKPAQRAEFYLATNVGAIQETPAQDGLAHFLEHMCFNGTKNFPGKGIINYLESIGASFGGNVNASTGVEETVYLLNNIPLVNESVVDSCLLIMHDYSHFVLCEDSEIDAERGVILEEKRTRTNGRWRIMEKSFPYYYGPESKYAGCNIIGSEENLKTFKPETLREFYTTWYRPDMQALIVVGDIDPIAVEEKIKAVFADISAPVNPKAKDVILTSTENEEPLVGIITDPEATGSSIEIIWRFPAHPETLNSTLQGYVYSSLQSLAGSIMNERFEDISSKADAPFLNANYGMGKLCESTEVAEAGVEFKDGEYEKALTALYLEIEKMRRYGFSDAELERAKAKILSDVEAEAKRAESRKNPEFVQPLIDNFFDNEPYLDPQVELQLAQSLLPQINAAVLGQFASSALQEKGISILYIAPEKDGLSKPEPTDLLNIISQVKASEIAAPAGEEIPSEFLDASKLKAGKIKARGTGLYGSVTATFQNGLEVVMLPTEYEKNRIGIGITSKGGRSLVPDADIDSFNNNIFITFKNNCGVSKFSNTTVSKMLAGKNLSVNPFIDDYTHGINASTTPQDLETTLQLINLLYTDPRFDREEYDKSINQLNAMIPNMVSQPNYQLAKALYETAYNSPRLKVIDENIINNASLETIERHYREMFKDVNGARMFIVGDFKPEEMLPMVAKYLGSIRKVSKKPSNWKYCGEGPVQGTIINDFRISMETPKVTVAQIYSSFNAFNIETEVASDALSYILNMVYTTTLREEEGGTYGASCYGQVEDQPYAYTQLVTVFDTNVELADKLREIAKDGIRKIATEGPSSEQFDKTIKNLEKRIPERRIRNNYWMGCLKTEWLYGYDNDKEYEEAVKALTPEKIQSYAAFLLNSNNFVELVMRPENL